jgi:hypothetical protein
MMGLWGKGRGELSQRHKDTERKLFICGFVSSVKALAEKAGALRGKLSFLLRIGSYDIRLCWYSCHAATQPIIITGTHTISMPIIRYISFLLQ